MLYFVFTVLFTNSKSLQESITIPSLTAMLIQFPEPGGTSDHATAHEGMEMSNSLSTIEAPVQLFAYTALFIALPFVFPTYVTLLAFRDKSSIFLA